MTKHHVQLSVRQLPRDISGLPDTEQEDQGRRQGWRDRLFGSYSDVCLIEGTSSAPPQTSHRRYVPPAWTSPRLLRRLTPQLRRRSGPLSPGQKPASPPSPFSPLVISLKHQSGTINNTCCRRFKDSWTSMGESMVDDDSGEEESNEEELILPLDNNATL